MTSRELLYVKTIAEAKTISKAAQKLFVAQPSLSQSLQRIEDALGTQLFNRTASGLTLTYAGEKYYQMAVRILKIYNDFENEISDINGLKTGRIHLGITNHLGTIVMSQVMTRFHQLYPGVEVFVSEENSDTLDQKILTGELDFAVLHAPSPKDRQPLIHYELLKDDPFVIVLTQDHPLLERAEPRPSFPYPVLDPRLLKNEPFLMVHKQQRILQITDSVLKKAGIGQPHIRLTLRSYETIRILASQGLGVTLLPSEYVTRDPGRFHPALLSIPTEYNASWSMCISTLKSSFLSNAAQMFMELVRGQFGGNTEKR